MRFFFRQTSILSLKCFCLIFCAISAFETSDYEIEEYNNAFFISEIFNKYGNNNSITYEGFEHLLENLGLGKLKFETNHDVSIHKVNGSFVEIHDELALHKHNHSLSKTVYSAPMERNKRNLIEKERDTRQDMAQFLKKRCLTPQDILITFGLHPYHDTIISPAKYLQMCPAIIYELDQKLCQGVESIELSRDPKQYNLTWIYASATVLIMGISGLLCFFLVPAVKKNSNASLIQFLISLAAGTLCGDALIHLLPQVLSKYGGSGLDLTPIYKGTTALLSIFLFFLVENVLKEIKTQKGKNAKPKKELDNMLPGSESEKNDLKHIREEDGIDSLAWMAIIGDILHNVTDGLSMGAAFTFSLSAGFASSIAIFCHELPHELGDYAILLSSGMSVKKALFYNFLSTVFSFIGMVAGILLGEFQNASLWINAFTAGSFLYISLTDLLPEMRIMTSKSNFKTFFVQILGIVCGGTLMLTIALYEDKIETILH